MTLLAVLESVADGVACREVDGAMEWLVGDVVFARLSGSTCSFRLDPLVARAALGTPDTSPSSRGSEWVDFSPAELDQMAVDRATAWFASAARRAADGSTRPSARRT